MTYSSSLLLAMLKIICVIITTISFNHLTLHAA